MSALVADGALLRAAAPTNRSHAAANAELVARLERLPVTPRLMLLRVIVGIATFFDAYTVLAIAFAMPQVHAGVTPLARIQGPHRGSRCCRETP
jgi:MFS transporter, putative metabolite:H+ symporter